MRGTGYEVDCLSQDRSRAISTNELALFLETDGDALMRHSAVDRVLLAIHERTTTSQLLTVKEAFHRIDTDGSGEIDGAELAQLCRESGLELSAGELKLVRNILIQPLVELYVGCMVVLKVS